MLIGLFLLAAVSAYAQVATATAPQVTIADPTSGETATIGGQAYTLSAVDTAGVQLAWRAERTAETQLAPGESVTLNEESYLVHIADGSRLQLVADRSAYAAQTAQIAAFERHVNGLWGVFIVSMLSAVFPAGFAFLPSR